MEQLDPAERARFRAWIQDTSQPLKWSDLRRWHIGSRAMLALLKSIEEQASALSAEDRARLVESMLESLQPSIAGIEAAWAEEIEKRVSAFERGELSSSSADEVFAEARQTLR